MSLGEYIGAGSGITKLLLHLSGNSNDASGNSNNGTDTDVTYSVANGRYNQGASFNGSSSGISIADAASIQFSTVFTIAVWVNFSALPSLNTDDQFVAKWRTSDPERSYRFGVQNSAGSYFLRTGVSSAGSSTVEGSVAWTPSTNTWYRLVETWDAGAFVFYVNGALLGSGTTTGVTSLFDNTDPLYIGRSGDLGYFNGKIDEVILENVAWTASQVRKDYTNSKGRFFI